MLKRLKSRLLRRKTEQAGEVSVENRRVKTLGEKFERYTEAITFAEAGLQETAQELVAEEQAEKAKLLVVGHEDTFSKQVADYALGFAERMGYEIIALNVNPMAIQSSRLLEPYSDRLRQEFNARCEQSVGTFQHSCHEKDIPFTHLAKFGEVDECIKEVQREIRRVEFVITEPETCPEEGKVAIPVFCTVSQ